jgi:hypothetical protein
MHCVCGHGDVGWRLSIEGIRDEISWVWNTTAYKTFLAMLSGLGNLEAYFLSGIEAFFIEHRGYTILLYRDNGGAAADDTAKGYMRRVAGGGSTTSRWLSNKGCLPLRDKSTTRLGAFEVNRCRLRHRCAAISRAQSTAVAAAWKKDGFEFLCFAAKTVGYPTKW